MCLFSRLDGEVKTQVHWHKSLPLSAEVLSGAG